MATITRQPFAPLDGARLQNLTSIKNRQNAISGPVKRKASEAVDTDDSENVDPTLFSKRSKGTDLFSSDFFKPSSFVLTKAASTPTLPSTNAAVFSPTKSASASAKPRALLQPKSPAARINTNISASLSAPAGRSPTRGSKRIGILSRRRTARVDPPAFGLKSSVPFSLDAALKGTIPSYAGSSKASNDLGSLHQGEMESSWFFDIHEDTPEQEMTNLLQHSTCTLDISSDEESERRASRERAEGRDKENVPPMDDISQTSARARVAAMSDEAMVLEKERGPLVEMNAADYYAEGCDDSTVIIIPGDEEEVDPTELVHSVEGAGSFQFDPELKQDVAVDLIMGKEETGVGAAVLEPIEGTGESFDLWESGSSKDEAEAPGSPPPAVEVEVAAAP